jgi:hypothetical protein
VVSDSEQFKNYCHEDFNVIGAVTFPAMVSKMLYLFKNSKWPPRLNEGYIACKELSDVDARVRCKWWGYHVVVRMTKEILH